VAGDVDHVVHPPVPGPGEPVPDDLSGGGLDGGGAGPGREPVPVGEPGDVTDVGQGAGGHDRPDPGQVHQRGARGVHHLLQLAGQGLDLLLHRDQLGQLLRGEPAAGLPD